MDRAKWLIVLVGYVHGPRLTSRLRQAWTQLRNPLADISFGPGCTLGPGFSIHAPWGGSFSCGAGCDFRRDFRAELEGPESRIEIGSASSFTYGVLMQCARSISVGDRTALGQANQVVDGNHRFRDLSVAAVHQGADLRPVRIGDDVMAMSKCTIIESLGDRVVLGANSVVTKAIPSYSVAVGAPARVIDYFGPQEPGDERSSRSERSGSRAPAEDPPASSQASRK